MCGATFRSTAARLPEATSVSLAAHLLGKGHEDQAAARAEQRLLLQETLNGMDAIDREVLTLRHCEQLSNEETATVLTHLARRGKRGVRSRSEANQHDHGVAAPFQTQGPWMIEAEHCSRSHRLAANSIALAERKGEVMPSGETSRNPVEILSEEFLERVRRGESVTPEDYALKHPELADEILALFPALLMMEDLGDETLDPTSSRGSESRSTPARPPGASANSACCAKWGAAAWAWFTRPSKSRSAAAWPSRYCRFGRTHRRESSSPLRARSPRRPPGCIIPTSSPSSAWVKPTAPIIM